MRTHVPTILAALAVIMAPLAATQQPSPDNLNTEPAQERAVVGSRLSQEELRERMARMARNAEQEEEGEELIQQYQAQDEDEEGIASAYYGYNWGYSAWSAAVHQAMNISARGDVVEIEDGTIFSVAHSDQWKVASWHPGAVVYVLPNRGYLWGLVRSKYDLCLYNETLGQVVEVNMSTGPFLNGECSWWITGIDDTRGYLYLQNGTTLVVDPSDRYLIQSWQPNEHVVVGCNDGWHRGSYPNIVVNVNTIKYVRVRVL